MSNFDSSKDISGRTQAERKQVHLLSDLSKSLDTQHHNTSLMHAFGEAFDSPETIPPATSGTGNPGSAPGPARSDHQHGVEVPTFIFPTGLNGWTNYGGSWLGTRYYKLGGRVWLEGLVTGGTMGANAMTLQTGYRPLGHLMFATVCGNVFGRLNIMNDGSVYFEPGLGTNSFCSMNCNFLPGA